MLARTFGGIDVLFHLAAIRLTQCAETPRLALEVMADGTFNVIEAAVAARIKRVVAASSASIYGMARSFPTAEDHHPYNNDTIYGAAKAFNEGLLASFRAMHGLDYVALRPFNVYGPRMDTAGVYTEVLVRWMERIARGQAPLIFGDGKQTMDFVFVDDVARAFLLAAASDASGRGFQRGERHRDQPRGALRRADCRHGGFDIGGIRPRPGHQRSAAPAGGYASRQGTARIRGRGRARAGARPVGGVVAPPAMTATFADIEAMLAERGWAAVDLPDPSAVWRTRDWLLAQLREACPDLRASRITTSPWRTTLATSRSSRISRPGSGRRSMAARSSPPISTSSVACSDPICMCSNIPICASCGPDRSDDAVPLHRDTYYGASPYEVSVVVPFTDMGPDCAVRAVSGSHIEPDAAYPYVQQESTAVTLGSPRHKLGYAYAPRLLDPALAARAEPMPAKVGQALIFGLSLVHGGGANHGDRTRFSTDIRVVSSLAPVQLDRGVRKDYFVPLCSSPISRSAERYRTQNGGLSPAEPGR